MKVPIVFVKVAEQQVSVFEEGQDGQRWHWEYTRGRAWRNEKNARRFLTDRGWSLS